MLGYILRLIFLIILVMIGLNIFAPERANEIIKTFSEQTDMIEEDTLKESLDKATKFTQDTFKEVSQTVNEKLDK